MAGLIPIPTTRITGLFARQRLTQQLQADQLALFRFQDQISTGQRIILPSDDAPSALRAIALQRLLERKTQLEENISTGQSFLGATDSSLGTVADQLFEIKASTLEVVGTATTQEQRDSAIAKINGTLESLVGIANTQFRGRYLFAGSQTSQAPYVLTDTEVAYFGNDALVYSYEDIGVLFGSNASGQAAFGGISAAVVGSVDLNPQLSEETLLSSLRGGIGIKPNGAFTISDGFDIRTIDISGAVRVGDVKRLIEENVPTGRELSVSITGQGIDLQFDPARPANSGANLIVEEVGTGTTAKELGIFTPTGVGTSLSVGQDIDPIIRPTTRLDDLLGTKARAKLVSGADNNDILIEASANGTALDGVTIEVVDGGDIGETASAVYDAFTKTLTVSVDDTGDTTANHVVDAINAEGTFNAELDLADSSSVAEAGSGEVSIGVTATTTGGSGETLDKSSGLRVVNGGQTFDITFDDAHSVNDLLNFLNGSEAGLLAEMNPTGTGINIRSRLSGNDFQIGENGGQTAAQLGVRSYTDATKLSELNYGNGVETFAGFDLPTTEGVDLTINTIDSQTFDVNLSGATSIDDVVNAINAVTGASVTAAAVSTGNVTVVQLTDNSIAGAEAFTVTQATGSLAAQYLGIVPNGETQTVSGGNTLLGSDSNYIDLTITSKDGQSFGVDLSSATTVGEVINEINAALATVNVTAQLAATGNGIEVVDTTGGGGPLTVTTAQRSQAAESLGLVPSGQTSSSTTSDRLTGEDRNYLETDSVFTTLIRLRAALEANDVSAISRAAAKLEDDIDRVTFARAEVGARQQGLEISQLSLEDEDIQLRSALSEEIDVDLVEAISNLTARQISLQASLQATGNLLQLSLLDFI